MKNRSFSTLLLFLILVTFTGCTMIQDIFEAGVWVGVIAILIIILIVFVIVRAVKT